ncbi:EAL domain-containing protein [Paraburkholderia sp. J12]|uniref:EAL domain-containing protein n=1 Tax=Paraburkholderia sp. J12 TaxID=2805432 RepID=UPI002ABE8D3C|nr:EAL domain-containing protein [Paraburkholderia sp. J12]
MGTLEDLPSLKIAEAVVDAMYEGRVKFATEPVCSVEGTGAGLLYWECLARVSDKCGRILRASEFVPALEAIGLIRQLDRYVVRRAIALLRANPCLCLGVNVSGASAVLDVVWEAMFVDLATTPDAASRLIVEITETEALERGGGRQFGDALRKAGCRLAVDDYGVGFGIETAIEVGDPDIVKIDASFLAGIRTGVFEVRRLAEMVSLASEISSYVVVEGVENESDLELAKEAGARWVQGFFFAEGQRFW